MTDASVESDNVAAEKRRLRTRLRERRRALATDARARFDAAINEAVVELAGDFPGGAVAAFRAFDGEPDLTAALADLAGQGRQLVLPVLAEGLAGVHLEFRIWDPSAPLHRNRFGIAEPLTGNRIALGDIGLVLVPLVGWDERGGRLGMGAGYYDRALAEVADAERPLRAGIAYEVQRVEKVPTDAHDIPLHIMISERGRFTCPR